MRNNTLKKIGIGWFFLMVLVTPLIWLGAIDWIQYDERVSGENSPFYDDVLNRPSKQIWANFTSEHTDTGAHKPEIFPTPIPSELIQEFAAWSDGATYIGNSGKTTSPSVVFDTAMYTMLGVIKHDRLNTAESLFRRDQATDGVNYNVLVFNFHKASDNRLGYSVYDANGVTRTYYSINPVFSTATQTRPIEVGITVDQTSKRIAFLYDGTMEAFQNTSTLYKPTIVGDWKYLGSGFNGAVYTWSVSQGQRYAPGYYTPHREGLSQCVRCIMHYDFNEGGGTILHDRSGSSDMTILGSWLPVGRNY